jgi:hypothetical protein
VSYFCQLLSTSSFRFKLRRCTKEEAARAYDAEVRRRGWTLIKRINFPDPADDAPLPPVPTASASAASAAAASTSAAALLLPLSMPPLPWSSTPAPLPPMPTLPPSPYAAGKTSGLAVPGGADFAPLTSSSSASALLSLCGVRAKRKCTPFSGFLVLYLCLPSSLLSLRLPDPQLARGH